jgi:FSR family fosmidomycin resistance protein-like MFS transporter
VYALAFVAGAFNGGPHSILVTMAQKTLPNRAGLASGLSLGIQFAIGALGVYLTGLLADAAGLTFALQANAALALVCTMLSFGLLLEKRLTQAAPASGD